LSEEFFLLQTAYNAEVEEVNRKITTVETTLEATLETYSNEVYEQIEYLENKISGLQTTVYVCIATVIIAIVGAFLLIKRMQ